jgi:hypothetical protein
MYGAADVLALLIIAAIWIGAALLAAILLYARTEYGARRSATIGAILIDTGLFFGAVLVFLGALPLVRIVWPGAFPPDKLRWVNLGILLGGVWLAVGRLLVWLLRGEGRGLWDRRRGRRGGIPD